MADPVAEKFSAALDAALRKLADWQGELLKAQTNLKRYLKMAEDAKKPSAYPAELVAFLKKAGVKYGDKDGDQKKNVKLLQDKLESLRAQETSEFAKVKLQIEGLQRATEATSSIMKTWDAMHSALVRNLGG
jgi:hypothetical protein